MIIVILLLVTFQLGLFAIGFCLATSNVLAYFRLRRKILNSPTHPKGLMMSSDGILQEYGHLLDPLVRRYFVILSVLKIAIIGFLVILPLLLILERQATVLATLFGLEVLFSLALLFVNRLSKEGTDHRRLKVVHALMGVRERTM